MKRKTMKTFISTLMAMMLTSLDKGIQPIVKCDE